MGGEVGQEAQQLVGLAGIGNGQHYVVRLDDTEVAVEYVERVDEEAGRAGRGERGCYLGTDVAALAHAGHNQLSPTVQDGVDGLVEVLVDVGNQFEQCLGFVAEAFDGNFSVLAHGSIRFMRHMPVGVKAGL